MSAPTLEPDARRLRDADSAGFRRASLWLPRGLLLVALALGLDSASASVHDLLRAPTAAAALEAAVDALWSVLVAALVIVPIAALLAGSAGPVDRARSRRLRLHGTGEPGLGLLLVAAALAIIALLALRGVIAGAARGADADLTALTALWSAWLLRGLALVGALLVLAGVFELVLSERARRRALRQTLEELREDARR